MCVLSIGRFETVNLAFGEETGKINNALCALLKLVSHYARSFRASPAKFIMKIMHVSSIFKSKNGMYIKVIVAKVFSLMLYTVTEISHIVKLNYGMK